MKDANKHLNNEDYHYANQQLTCSKDILRGAIVKYCVVGNSDSINFHLNNKVLIKQCVKFYHECWEKCVALHSTDSHKNASKEDVLEIIEEATKDDVVKFQKTRRGS